MKQNELIASRILADMRDGVMSIDRRGTLITVNQAAERILGFSAQSIEGKSFGEVFFSTESNDEFNQAILDAVYESAVGHQKTVSYTQGERHLTLSLTTSLLRASGDASNEAEGVIVVFSDVTELKALQMTEAKMAHQLAVNHKELQDAFRQTEAGNAMLAAALRKIQVGRMMAAAFTALLILGLGGVYWRQSGVGNGLVGKEVGVRVSSDASGEQEITVGATAVSSTIALTGRLAPLRTVNLNSPLTGRIQSVEFQYGDVVTVGQTLLVMDTAEAQVKYREARAAAIRAEEVLRQMTDWDNGGDVIRAKRSLTKARLALEAQKKNLDESERLYKQGIIPGNEYDASKQQYSNQLLDYQSAEDELSATQRRGSGENRELAKIEYENAATRMRQIEMELNQAVLKSPVAGIVIKPPNTGVGKTSKLAAKGESFSQGEILLAVGDLTGLSVTAKVDEVDVTKLKQGQQVRISGDAYQDVELLGSIRAVSPQADEADARALPSFLISVSVLDLTAEQRKRILVGMSANLEVTVYENAQALMVPVGAVINEGGKHYVMMKTTSADGRDSSRQRKPVTTGHTTLDSVEVVQGLKVGDVILTKTSAN